VRLDLKERLGQQGLRMDAIIRRTLQRATERLEAQRRLLPKPADLAAPWVQKADELGERLRRGLERRADGARIAFAGSASRLSPAILRRRLALGQDRLSSLRLPTAQLQRRLGEAQSRLDALGRLADTLHPEAPLKRGFARVSDAEGRTIMGVDAARAAGQISIRFADGSVDAVVGGGVPRAIKPKAKTTDIQNDLFGGNC
jgi:exodeoxyribonuclease VII large subunit